MDDTSSILILAVKGLTSVKEADATPVLTMSIGNVREALLTIFCFKAGIVAGKRIWDRACWSDSIGVELVVPVIVVSASTPCKKFCSNARPAETASP